MKHATPEQLLHVAKKYHQEGNLDNAEHLYKTVLAVKPELAEAWHLLGMVCFAKGDHMTALDNLKKAISLDKNNPDYHNNIGEIYRLNKMLDEAELHYKFSIRLKPDNSDAYSNLALVCKAKGDITEAKLNFSRSLQCNPKNINTLLNVGSLYQSLGEYSDAIECYIAVMGIQPENPYALRGAAFCFSETGEYNTAAGMLSKLTAGKQNMFREKVDLALLTLRGKDFRKGFSLFEARLKDLPQILEGEEKKLWRGTSLKGKKLYVYFEKAGLSGYGDTIMFMRLLHDLARFEPEKVIFRVQPELAALAAMNVPEFVTVTLSECTDFDLHTPLLSLPLLLNLRAKTMPMAEGYIKAEDRVFEEIKPGKKNIGIAFQTSRQHVNHERRSVGQSAFEPLLEREDIKLFYISPETPENGLDSRITDMREHIGSFKDTADIIACLDMVITPDTSLVHLAGAMGKDTVLLLDFLSDWRWFTPKNGQPSVWYSSVKTFIRQKEMSWTDVVGSLNL